MIKPYNRPAGEGKTSQPPCERGNAPLLPPAAASPPAGEILATLCIEMLLGEMVPCGVLSHRFCGGEGGAVGTKGGKATAKTLHRVFESAKVGP